jgi:hypothetical protein
MTPRLTLIGGLRYDIPPNYHSTDLSGLTNSFSNGGQIVWANSSFTSTYSKYPGANPNYLTCCAPSTLARNDRLDFGPRLGIAFRPLAHNDNLVIRMGYGIFYDNWERYYDLSNFTEDDAYTAVGAPLPPATGFESVSPLALKGLWLPPLLSGALFTNPSYNGDFETKWPDNHNPNNQQWNFDVQYAFAKNLMLDVGYVGEHRIDEETQYFWNKAYPPAVANDPATSCWTRRRQPGLMRLAFRTRISPPWTSARPIRTSGRIHTPMPMFCGRITMRFKPPCRSASPTA